MSILGGNVATAPVAPAAGQPDLVQKLAETPKVPQTAAAAPTSTGTALLLEKIEAGKAILKLVEDQQRQNLEYARMFAELAKGAQPLTGT